MSICLRRAFPFGTVLGPLSDLLGLRFPLPLQSRTAQISDGIQACTKHLHVLLGNDFLSTHR